MLNDWQNVQKKFISYVSFKFTFWKRDLKIPQLIVSSRNLQDLCLIQKKSEGRDKFLIYYSLPMNDLQKVIKLNNSHLAHFQLERLFLTV